MRQARRGTAGTYLGRYAKSPSCVCLVPEYPPAGKTHRPGPCRVPMYPLPSGDGNGPGGRGQGPGAMGQGLMYPSYLP